MGRIVRRLDTEQYMLRKTLIDLYRAWPFYRHHIDQLLRPPWRQLSRRYDWSATTNAWNVEDKAEDQRFLEEDGQGAHDPDLAGYVHLLHDTVCRHMGLTTNGEPARWVLDYVQLDVSNPHGWAAPLVPGHAMFWKWEQLQIELHISEASARLLVTRHAGDREELPEINARGGPFGGVFQEWEALREEAHTLIDREIDRLSGAFTASYRDRGLYQARNQTDRDVAAELALLRELLTARSNRRPAVDRPMRERLREHAHVLGIDLPAASDKVQKN